MTDETLFPLAFAAKALTGIDLIDTGHTVDVRFTAADGRMIAVLIPRAVFAELQAKQLGAPTRRDGPEQAS
ncbi:hypothetical protein [Methylorubrum extorquens]|uniref:hypothetical protein n=1 Tax=Methylorubrum extorquens TaxID=408 RepID=UPI000AB92863|nr:hypothetical protein [Methylorubrum extorquens]WIU39825.1 hypothetical protein KQ926_25230 [Methylorubrum extorquens]